MTFVDECWKALLFLFTACKNIATKTEREIAGSKSRHENLQTLEFTLVLSHAKEVVQVVFDIVSIHDQGGGAQNRLKTKRRKNISDAKRQQNIFSRTIPVLHYMSAKANKRMQWILFIKKIGKEEIGRSSMRKRLGGPWREHRSAREKFDATSKATHESCSDSRDQRTVTAIEEHCVIGRYRQAKHWTNQVLRSEMGSLQKIAPGSEAKILNEASMAL